VTITYVFSTGTEVIRILESRWLVFCCYEACIELVGLTRSEEMVMSHGVGELERSGRRSISLKPRLLKCTTLAIENMATSQKNYLPLEMTAPPRLETENHGADINLDLDRKNLYYRAKI
jgi:hypothetical protein